MHQYLFEFFTIASLHLLAVMSPGPDFILISKNSFAYSRRTALYTALGLSFGILMHATYSLIGIGLIISKSIIIFSAIKYLGAGYLIYIGLKALKAQPAKADAGQIIQKADLTKLAAIKNGFLTNALNPKVTLFFLALFTQVVHQTTPWSIKILYGLEMSAMTFIWFALVATILTHSRVQKPFLKIQHKVERIMGALLIALGIKVIFSSNH